MEASALSQARFTPVAIQVCFGLPSYPGHFSVLGRAWVAAKGTPLHVHLTLKCHMSPWLTCGTALTQSRRDSGRRLNLNLPDAPKSPKHPITSFCFVCFCIVYSMYLSRCQSMINSFLMLITLANYLSQSLSLSLLSRLISRSVSLPVSHSISLVCVSVSMYVCMPVCLFLPVWSVSQSFI